MSVIVQVLFIVGVILLLTPWNVKLTILVENKTKSFYLSMATLITIGLIESIFLTYFIMELKHVW